MLRAQVKRLCSENNWLRTELADHQQLLQDTELQLARVKEEKDQLEFQLHNLRVRIVGMGVWGRVPVSLPSILGRSGDS